jgi:NADPH:quinone reductase-like Zn-dependent oxidoreductase
MKAIVQDRFGPPDVLRLADTGPPEIGPRGVLVRSVAPIRKVGAEPPS